MHYFLILRYAVRFQRKSDFRQFIFPLELLLSAEPGTGASERIDDNSPYFKK